jgi:hypothetical protein
MTGIFAQTCLSSLPDDAGGIEDTPNEIIIAFSGRFSFKSILNKTTKAQSWRAIR